MSGIVVLHGGAEFQAASAPMDTEVLLRAGAGPVVVLAGAASPGRDYATATANGVRHFAGLGADASAAPDSRVDLSGTLAALAAARVLVLPGGSPTRLRAVLTGPVGDAVLAVLARGGTVYGASAGAMLLCAWTVLPDSPRRPVVTGLGAVARTVILPHWSGERRDWLTAVGASVPADTRILGLPEASGVLFEGDGPILTLTALGPLPAQLLGTESASLELGVPIPWPD